MVKRIVQRSCIKGFTIFTAHFKQMACCFAAGQNGSSTCFPSFQDSLSLSSQSVPIWSIEPDGARLLFTQKWLLSALRCFTATPRL